MRRYDLRLPGAAGADAAAARRRHARGRRPTSGRFTFRIKPGIFFADDPAFKGKQRELIGGRLRLLASSASSTRAGRARSLPTLENARSSACDELRQAAHRRTSAVRLRHARSRACARSTATRCSSSSASRARASPTTLSRPVARRRGGARGGRVLRRQDHGAPGRHRPVPARRVAAQLADRARAQPDLPRGVLRRGAARRRRRWRRRCGER